jgi:hypothetical protein
MILLLSCVPAIAEEKVVVFKRKTKTIRDVVHSVSIYLNKHEGGGQAYTLYVPPSI